MANDTGRRMLPHDKSGFLVGERLVSGMDAVKSDTDEILSLLRSGLKRGEQADGKAQRSLDAIQRNTRDTRSMASSRNSGGGASGGITRAAREAGGPAAAGRSGPGRAGAGGDGRERQRNERGQFMPSGRSDAEKAEKSEAARTGILASLVSAVRGRFGLGGAPDAENLDPTLTAIHEAGQLVGPFARVGGMMFKAGGWLVGRFKKKDDVPKEQRRHNRLIEKLLKRIAGEGGSHGGRSLFGGLFGSLTSLLKPLGFLLRGGGAGLGLLGAWEGGQAIGKWIYDKFEPQIAAVADAIGSSVKTAIAAYESAVDTVSKWIESAVNGYKSAVDTASKGIEWIANKLGWLKDKGGAVIDRVRQDFGLSPSNPNRAPAKTFTPEKAAAIAATAQRLGIDPNDLATAISFETAGTFDPAKKNPTSSATGLIQFTSATAKGLGTSTKALKGMSFDDQMVYVEKYLKAMGVGKEGQTSLGAIYDAIQGIPKEGYSLKSKNPKHRAAVYANPLWDVDGNGDVLPGEAVTNPKFQAHRAAYFPAARTASLSMPGASAPAAVPAPKVPPAPKVQQQVGGNKGWTVVNAGVGGGDISQNVADRALAHALTGGLGMDNMRGN